MRPTPPNSDADWMERALDLARGVRGHVWPNPPVGCVIVKDGRMVGEAATHPGGRPHAERQALDQARGSARGAALFVTLEPCCHWGKTPPCADAIIEARIARVVCAVQDPDPRVNGGGFVRLTEAGVDVTNGLCSDAARAVMSGFFHRVQFGVPEVTMSAEGPDVIPEGADAVLTSQGGQVLLKSRSGRLGLTERSLDDVLRRLGALGLTSVAIPSGDPFWAEGPARHTALGGCGHPKETGASFGPGLA